MDISTLPRCGNAPKMEHAIDLTVALLAQDSEKIDTQCTPEFESKIVGQEQALTPEDLHTALLGSEDCKELSITDALSHGNGALAEGEYTTTSGHIISFAHVVNFVNTGKNALIKASHWYLVAS